MSESKFGVENIKKVVGFALGLANDIPKALADGKINLKDAPLFLGDAFKLPGVIGAVGQLKNEFLDMDATEAGDIEDFVKTTIGNPDANVAEVIEACTKVVMDISLVVQDGISLAEAIIKLKAA